MGHVARRKKLAALYVGVRWVECVRKRCRPLLRGVVVLRRRGMRPLGLKPGLFLYRFTRRSKRRSSTGYGILRPQPWDGALEDDAGTADDSAATDDADVNRGCSLALELFRPPRPIWIELRCFLRG
jgi:hypothetical protein